MKNSNCSSQSHMAALASEAVAIHNDKNSLDKDSIEVLINQECDKFRSALYDSITFYLDSDSFNSSVIRELLYVEIVRLNFELSRLFGCFEDY